MGDMADDFWRTRDVDGPPGAAHHDVTAVRIKTPQGYRFYRFTPERRAAVAAALRHMSGRCDGAVKDDAVGFNRQDAGSEFVKAMVTLAWGGADKGRELTDRQAAWALTMLWKYKATQLESFVDALWPEGMDDDE